VQLEDISGRTLTNPADANIVENLDVDSDINIDNTTPSTPTPTPNTIDGTADTDTLSGTSQADIIDGKEDNANTSSGRLDGSLGGDILSYSNSNESIQVDLRNLNTDTSIGQITTSDTYVKYSTGDAFGDVAKNIENFQCSNNGDQVILSGDDSKIYFVTGGNGNDTFVAVEPGTYRVNAAGGENTFVLPGNESDYTVGPVQGFPEYEQAIGNGITLIYKKTDDGNPITNNVQFDANLTSENAADKLIDSITNSTLSVSNPDAIAEGNAIEFGVNLSNAKAGATSVVLNVGGISESDYEKLEYTLNGVDYVEFTNGSSVDIPEGSTGIGVRVTTTDDSGYEGDETITLSATSSDSTIANPNTTVTGSSTITDEADGRPELSVADITINEDGTATFVVTLSKAIEADVSFDYKTHDGSAKAGEDYIAVDGRTTITAGQTQVEITVNITDDFKIDNKEEFHLVLHNPTDNVTITDQSATATIIDNQSITNLSVVEADSERTYQLELDQTPVTDVTVMVAYSGVKDGETITGTKEVTIVAGETTATFDLQTEVDEILSANISETQGGYLENLTFAPLQPSLTISDDTADAVEGNEFIFDVGLTFKKSTDTLVTLDFALEDNYNNQTRIIDADDYSALQYSTDNGQTWQNIENGQATIAANTNGIKVKLVSTDDDIKEGSETITLSAVSSDAELANTNTTLTSNTVTITDNETVPTLSIDDVTIDEKSGKAIFTVTLSEVTQHAVEFNYRTVADSADESDYTAVNTSATIAAGELTTQIEIDITDDFYIEDLEQFKVELTSVTGDNAALSADVEGVATLSDELNGTDGVFDLDASKASESKLSISQAKSYIVEGTDEHVKDATFGEVRVAVIV
jgi:hypothetical protein